MSWDETSPVGTDAINQGDNVIRQMKTDIRTYAAEEHVALTTVPSTLTGYHKFPAGSTGSRPSANGNSRRIYFNTTKRQIDVENIASASFPEGSPSWFDGGFPLFPTGTALVFYQAAPPAGWTAVAINDKALRVVTSGGTGGSTGGTNGFAAAFAASTTGAEAAHTHTYTSTQDTDASKSGGSGGLTFAAGGLDHTHAVTVAGTTAAGSSHTHTTPNYAPAYADVVVATKD